MAEVIKASTLRTGTDGTVPRPAAFQFTDIKGDAETYMKQVQAKAAEMIAEAKKQAEQIKIQAQQAGKQAALEAAEATIKKQIETQLSQVMPTLDTIAEQVMTMNATWLEQWEKNLVTLSVAIAERVIRRELTDKSITLQWVREALELGLGTSSLAVHLHPDDCQTLRSKIADMAQRLAKIGPVDIVEDASVQRGGCRVQTDYGIIDQTAAAQLARISYELEG
jgi:flagellar assembly protein FliH